MAQNIDQISLPLKTDNNGVWPTLNNVVTIYVTKDHEVYVDSIQITYWDNLMPAVLNIHRQLGMETIYTTPVLFHIDRKAKYRFIDRVKEEVARVKNKFFLYKIGDTNNALVESNKIDGTIQKKWIGPIPSKELEFAKWELTGSKLPDWLENIEPLPNDELKNSFAKYLYNGSLSDVNSILDRHPHILITLLPDKKYRYNGTVRNMDDISAVSNLVISGTLLLYTFDPELDYEDYIYFLKQKKRISLQRKAHYKTFGAIVEISYSLESKMKDWGLKL